MSEPESVTGQQQDRGQPVVRPRGETGSATPALLFGIPVIAPFPLPLLPRAPATCEPPMAIERGSVEPRGEPIWRGTEEPICAFFRRDSAIVLAWESMRFAVQSGSVTIDAVDLDLALDLLRQPVWSVVLAGRGREALHGCVVERGGAAVALLGASGSGKTTAGRLLIARGWRLVTDDLLTFTPDLRAVPGPPIMKIAATSPSRRSAAMTDFDGKQRVVLPVSPAPVPLTLVVVLRPGATGIRRLTGLAGVAALLDHVYNPVITRAGQAARRLELTTRIVEHVPVVEAPARALTAADLERLARDSLRDTA